MPTHFRSRARRLCRCQWSRSCRRQSSRSSRCSLSSPPSCPSPFRRRYPSAFPPPSRPWRYPPLVLAPGPGAFGVLPVVAPVVVSSPLGIPTSGVLARILAPPLRGRLTFRAFLHLACGLADFAFRRLGRALRVMPVGRLSPSRIAHRERRRDPQDPDDRPGQSPASRHGSASSD
jgi:hypothetical protein